MSLFTNDLLQLLDMSLASIKLIDTWNLHPEPNAAIHSSASDFAEYHDAVVLASNEHTIVTHVHTAANI